MTRSRGLAFGDNLRIGNDFPAYRERGRALSSLRAGRPRRTTTGWPSNRAGVCGGKCIQDNFKRRRIRHTAVTLTVHEFGLNSTIIGFGEKVHSARSLHAKVQESVVKLSRKRKGIDVSLTRRSAWRSRGNQCPASGFLYRSGTSPVPLSRDAHFQVNGGITVNKTTQTVESATGAFHIEDVYPLDRWRPLSGEADRRRARRGVGGYLSRRTRGDRRSPGLAPRAVDREWRREPMTMAQQRPLGGLVRAGCARPLCLCHRGLDRRIRHLAAWI